MAGYIKTSKRTDWETPQALFNRLDEVFDFTIDLACNPGNCKCAQGITPDDDPGSIAHKIDQARPGAGWMNPPYDDIWEWTLKAWKDYAPSLDPVVMLIPASTEVKAWAQIVWRYAHYVLFFNKRLRFEHGGKPAAAGNVKGSALVVFSRHEIPNIWTLEDLGIIIDMQAARFTRKWQKEEAEA
jgi:site-specific DNA-methyltransferase (adenine-specific)